MSRERETSPLDPDQTRARVAKDVPTPRQSFDLPKPASWGASQAEWEWFCYRTRGRTAEMVTQTEARQASAASGPVTPRSPKKEWRESWKRKAHRLYEKGSPPAASTGWKAKRDAERLQLMKEHLSRRR